MTVHLHPRPGTVTAAAVLGFVLGAGGVIGSLFMLMGGISAMGMSENELTGFPGLSGVAGVVGGILVGLSVLAIAWTVLIILGGVHALWGRSRVPLIVAGSISIAFGLLSLFGGVGDRGGDSAGGILLGLVTLTAAIAIVVLLSTAPTTAYFRGHRARRGS